MIMNTYGKSSVKKSSIYEYEWNNIFKNDSARDVADRQKSGRPDTTSVKIEEIRELLQINGVITVRDIAAKVGLNTFSLHSVITKELGKVQGMCSLDPSYSDTGTETAKSSTSQTVSYPWQPFHGLHYDSR